MLNSLCNYSEDCKESQLQPQLCYKDTAGYMDSSNPIVGGHFGFSQRWTWTKNRKFIDMKGPIVL